MNSIVPMLCLFCAVTTGPHPQPVKNDFFFSYRYEALSGGKYLLRLSTSDLGLDWDGFREWRMRDFAERFADRACSGRFQLAAADAPSWPKDRPLYTKQYVFRCR